MRGQATPRIADRVERITDVIFELTAGHDGATVGPVRRRPSRTLRAGAVLRPITS